MLGSSFCYPSIQYISIILRKRPVQPFHGIVQVSCNQRHQFFVRSRFVFPFQIVDGGRGDIQIKTVKAFPEFKIAPSSEEFRFTPCMEHIAVIQSQGFCGYNNFICFSNNTIVMFPELIDITSTWSKARIQTSD